MLFKYGNIVTGINFYDRSKAQSDITKLLKHKQSFMLKGPRRYGKTSLIKHVLDKKQIDYFYIDLRKIPRLEKLNDKLVDYIYSKIGVSGFLEKIKKNVITFLKEHKTTIKINFELFEASVELYTSKDVDENERLITNLDIANKFAKALDITLYFVFDEFQDIKRHEIKGFDILEMLRGAMQHHQNVCYSFLGSNMSMMTSIFDNKKSPFYNFCRKMNLTAFDIKELSIELIEAFKSKKIVFANIKDLDNLLIRLKGHPANTMLVMQNLEFTTEDLDIKLITNVEINNAYNDALNESNDLVTEYLKEIQTKEHLHDVIYRIATNENQVLDSKSIYQKYSLLEDMGYICKESRGVYKIIDGFLEDILIEQ